MFTEEKIRLTALRPEDMPLYRTWSSEVGFGRNYNSSPIREVSEKQVEEWLQQYSDKDYRFAIRSVDHDNFMGVCAVEDIEWPHRVGWLSIALGTDFQGSGCGTEAMRLLMNYAWNELNLQRLQLTVFEYNNPPLPYMKNSVFKKKGFPGVSPT